jgi:hypothetical protein
VAGFVGAVANPEWFVMQQSAHSSALDTTRNARVVALQLGNVYLLLAMVSSSSSPLNASN